MTSGIALSPGVPPTREGPVAYVPFTVAPFLGARAFPEERL